MNEIKMQMLEKMGDLSKRKHKVMKGVNNTIKSKNHPEKRIPWSYYVTFASFVVILLVGGTLLLPTLFNEQTADEDNPIIDPVEKSYYEELKQFFPPNGTVATFAGGDYYSDGFDIETHWLSERYVQEIMYAKVRDCDSCEESTSTKTYLYRITNDEIQVIYDGSQIEWTIEELDELPTLNVKIKAPIEVGTEFNGEKIISVDEKLSTPYGDFSNVVVIESNPTEEFHSISHFVPNYGLVKRNIEGFWHSELKDISFGNKTTEETDYSGLLKSYFFPPEDLDQFFVGGFENGGVKVQTRWLSDKYVQQISHSDGGSVERIFKITNNQIELIYESSFDDSKTSVRTVDELEQLSTLKIVMKAPFTIGDVFDEWTLIDTSGKVSTLYDEFENVLILERKSEDYLARKYYAAGFGEVKMETMFYNENSGQYEEMINTELSSFGPIMNEVSGNLKFRVFEEDKFNYDLSNDAELSPSKTRHAILDGRGIDFEGINQLIVENLKTGKFTIYKYRYEYEQKTPKDIEWIDENRLYVIIGFAYGTVTMGGDLYILNVVDHSITPVFEANNSKEEIMSIKANGDGSFTYKKHIYEDEELSVGHVVEEIITPPIK